MKPFCLIALLCAGCVQHAPDPSRVVAATKRVEASQEAVRTIHKQEREKIKEAQETADTISVASLNLLQKVDALAKILPEQYQGPMAEIRGDVTDLQAKETMLGTGLVQAWQKNDQVEQHLADTDANLIGLKREQGDYYAKAEKQAVEQSKALNWYRWHFWLSWICLGTGFAACVTFAIVKWGAKWSAKLAVAAGKAGI